MRKKALIAFAFASGILNSQLPAIASEPTAESKDSVVERIANYTQITPGQRAYYLLNIAQSLITGTKRTQLEEQYKPMFSGRTNYWRRLDKKWESGLASWAERISAEGRSSNKAQTGANSQSASPENMALADEAIKRALTELDKDTVEPFAKLHLCFIASRLCKKVGNAEGMHYCNTVIDQALRACEGDSNANEAQIRAATSLLNAEAFGFIPVVITDFGAKGAPWPKESQQTMPFKEADFKEAEKIKLRAVAMADKLNTESHVRRKAHRDLTLWYMRLGKMEQSDKQKQLLFNLVGFKDDSVLYPQQEGCGHLTWWKQEKITAAYKCGMG